MSERSHANPGETSTAPTFETEAYRDVKAAVSDGVTPLLIVGAGGMGKTTLLRLLQRDRLAMGGRACFVPLAEVRGESDFIRAFQEQLWDSASARMQPLVVASSADDLSGSLVDIVNAHASPPLILLDALDEALNEHAVLRLVRLLTLQTRSTVVVSARHRSTADTGDLHFHVVMLAPLSSSEMERFFAWTGLNASASPRTRRLQEQAGGNPLLATVLSDLMEDGVGPEFEEIAAGLPPLRVLVQRFLMREQARQGVELKSLLRPLARLALRGSARLSDLGLPPREAELLKFSPFVRRDGELLSIFHRAIATELIAVAGLPQATVRLRDLEFGAEEAERDTLLAGSFVNPPGIADLRAGRSTIVVGDRGAGKSALFTALTSSAIPDHPGIHVLTLEDPAELMLRLESRGEKLATAEQFRAAWLLSLACSLATQLELPSPRHRRMATRLRAALPGTTPDASVLGRLLSLWYKIRRTSVKFQLGPIVLEPAKATDPTERGGRSIDISAFLQETAVALKECGRRVFVAVDRVDEVHKYSRDLQERMVQGLFLAEGSLSRTPEISLLIFIRTDLFQVYDIQEKNKLVSRTLRLRWSRDSLLRMLVHRIFANRSLAGLAETVMEPSKTHLDEALAALFPQVVEGEVFTDWLWRSLANGNGDVSPRQLVLLLVLVREASKGSDAPIETLPLLSEDLLRKAMSQLSEFSFSETISDFRVAKALLRSCRAGKIETFVLTDVEQLFDPAEGPTGLQIELLERLGVLERIVEQDDAGRRTAKFRIPSLYTRCWGTSPS